MSTTLPQVGDLVRQIHATPGRASLVVSGVGAQALAWLFAEPGTSRTVLDAQIPYSIVALDEYVGGPAEQHVSAFEALRMADAALARARKLAAGSALPADTPILGVACTAAIATDRVRRGENRCHVAWTDGTTRKAFSLVFNKGERDRAGEEAVGSAMILNALAEAKGLSVRLPLELLPGESIVESS